MVFIPWFIGYHPSKDGEHDRVTGKIQYQRLMVTGGYTVVTHGEWLKVNNEFGLSMNSWVLIRL